MAFQISKMMDVGTSNPIVARLGIGLDEAVKMARIPEEKKKLINEGCFEIMIALVEAEKAAKPLMDEIRAVMSKLATEGVKTQSGGRVIETPGVTNLENTKVFFKFSKQALQKLASIMGVIMDKKYTGPHFDRVRDDAQTFFGKDHVVSKLLMEDHAWLKNINDLRNEDEHPKTSKPFTKPFHIEQRPDGKFLITPPMFFEGTQALSGLEVFSHNLLTFSEEIVGHSLAYFFPEIVALYDIPEEQRNPSNPVRFRLGLKAEVKFP
jgi:hypothetical protein